MSTVEPQTVLPAAWVYGEEALGTDDPTELFHEASRLYPNVVDGWTVGASLLARSPELRASASRAVRRRTGLPAVQLPEPAPLPRSLDDLVGSRRSIREYGDAPLELAQLSTLLHTCYGVTGALGRQPLRAVPSGGALHPLELYVAALCCERLERALYHYDPLRSVLERVRPLERDELEGLTPYDDLLVPSAAVTMITAVFWRSRFKYGQRAYRFALLEAGHVAQSYVLAATALDLAVCPVGGFYDRRVDALLGVDGLYEASLYLLPVGARAT